MSLIIVWPPRGFANWATSNLIFFRYGLLKTMFKAVVYSSVQSCYESKQSEGCIVKCIQLWSIKYGAIKFTDSKYSFSFMQWQMCVDSSDCHLSLCGSDSNNVKWHQTTWSDVNRRYSTLTNVQRWETINYVKRWWMTRKYQTTSHIVKQC